MNKKILKRTIIVVIILVVVNALLFVNFGNNVINKSNEVVNDIGKTTISFFENIYTQFEDKKVLEKEKKLVESDNDSLKEQNRLLASENENVTAENDELNDQVKAITSLEKKHSEYEYIPGEIIRRDGNDWYEKATINLGKKDGITEDSAVLYQATLLGYVDEVFEDYSTIRLITSENVVVNIPSMVTHNKKNYNGQISHFDKTTNTFEFESFKPDVKLDLHDKIYTNGYTNGVPSKILIGTIVDVDENNELKKTIYKVEPAENLYDARNITVMEAKNEK